MVAAFLCVLRFGLSLRIIFWIVRWWWQEVVRDPRFRNVECAESAAVIGVELRVRISINVCRETERLVIAWAGTGPPTDNPFQALSVVHFLLPEIGARASTSTTRLGFDQLIILEVREQI